MESPVTVGAFFDVCPLSSNDPFKANCYDSATNSSARAFVEAAWVAIGCSAYFGDFYKRKRALGKKPTIAILATARLIARITWQLLTQRRAYTSLAQDPIRPKPACRADCLCSAGRGQGSSETAQRSFRFPSTRLPGREWSRSEHEPWTDVSTLAELFRETAQNHDHYEKTHPKHNWWDWYAPYLNARQNGSRLKRQPPPLLATWRRSFIFCPDDAVGPSSPAIAGENP
jgi:hypothetical protein